MQEKRKRFDEEEPLDQEEFDPRQYAQPQLEEVPGRSFLGSAFDAIENTPVYVQPQRSLPIEYGTNEPAGMAALGAPVVQGNIAQGEDLATPRVQMPDGSIRKVQPGASYSLPQPRGYDLGNPMQMQGIPEGGGIPQGGGFGSPGQYLVPTVEHQRSQLEEQQRQAAIGHYNQTVEAITNSHIPTAQKAQMLFQAAQQFNGFLQHGVGAEQGARIHQQDRAEALSQGEFLHLQRLKNAVGAVDQAVSEGKLAPEEAANFKLRLKTGIDPLEQRLKQTQIDQRQEQVKQMQDAAAQAKSIEIQNQQFDAQAKEKGIGVLKWTDPDTGRIHRLFQDPKTGAWYNPLQANGSNSEDKQFELDTRHYETQHKAWLAANEAYQRAWAKEREAVAKQNREEADDPANKGTVRRATDEELDAAADRRVRLPRPGPEPQAPQRRQPMPPPQAVPNPGVVAPGVVGGPGAAQRPVPTSDSPVQSREKPFIPGKPETMSETQKFQVAGIAAFRDRVLTGKGKDASEMIRMAADKMHLLLSQWGSYDSMPPPTKAEYDQAEGILRSAEQGKMYSPQSIPLRSADPEVEKMGRRRPGEN